MALLKEAAAAATSALGADAPLARALAELARDEPRSVDAHLHRFGEPTLLDGTSATCHAYFVMCGADGKPRTAELAERLAAHVVDYCIPRSRIDEARRAMEAHGSTRPFVRLETEAKELFTHLSNSGEGGELLLWLLLELVLRVPQVLCKMPLKTSREMHVHGVDGVHARTTDDGGLAVYWGESKLYADVASGVRECLKSLAEFLVGDRNRRGRDMLLLRDHADLGDPSLSTALKSFFNDDDIASTRLEFRGACLIGFDYDKYPDQRSIDEAVAAQLEAAVGAWAGRVLSGVTRQKLESVVLEVFLVPFPSVEDFRAEMGKALGL